MLSWTQTNITHARGLIVKNLRISLSYIQSSIDNVCK